MITAHLSRLRPGSPFVVGEQNYTLVSWNECSALVRVSKKPKLVQITDRYGNEREFYAEQGGSIRIASDILVQVETGTPLRSFIEMAR